MKAQYAILRFAKYKGPEIGHIEAHNERTKEKYASNPDVDTSRSHLNFHLVSPERKYRAEAEKQIAEAGCRTRSDSVRVVEALVTASPEFFKGKKKAEVKAYFQEALDFKGGWFYLEMNVRDDQKLVEIWLTNAEKIDPVLREGLKEIYAKYKTKKYMVAVFESGKGDLYENTRDLLLFNRRRSAEKAVQQAKKQRAAGMER